MPTAFKEFKGIMDTVIPNNSDPNPAIDKILAHHARLISMKWDISSKVLAMMMLSKAPQSMEAVVQLVTQVSEKPLTDDAFDIDQIVKVLRLSWETSGRSGVSRFNQQRATKLSAVKPAGNQPPQFQYQQQQHGDFPQQQRGGWGLGGGRGRPRRGKRGGQKKAQQQLQQATVQSEPNQAGPSQPPPHQWVPAPTPPSYASGPANMGYFAAQMKAGHPLPPTLQLPPSTPISTKPWT